MLLLPRNTTPRQLLFTAVTNRDGADTRILIANTSEDPFGTSQAGGTCTISYFGDLAGGGSVPSPSTSTRIDPGNQLSFSLSQGNLAQGISAAPGFRGYVTADCTFPLARGTATTVFSVSGGGPAAESAAGSSVRNPKPTPSGASGTHAGSLLQRQLNPNDTGAALLFIPMTPCRVVDTRTTNGPFGGPPIPGGNSRDFAIPNGACGVPSTAQAYSLNVTVVPVATLGYLTVWPAGLSRPLASTLNSLDGRFKSDAVIVPGGTGGAVSVFATDTTNVVLDINGYYVAAPNSSALAFYPLAPCRVADTRKATGSLGGPSMSGGQTRTFPILSASTCNIPSSAQAYSLNLTAVPKGSLGYLTAWPSGQTRPGVSNLNAPTGTVTANAAIVKAGSGGSVDIFASAATDVVIDINGYFAPMATGGLALYNVTPCRVLDTRKSTGAFTGKLDVNVTGSACNIPATGQAYVLNATVVPPASLGYLTLWPQGQAQPVVSTLNALDGAITSNLALAPTNNGSISSFASSLTQLVLDIFGYFAPLPTSGGTITVSNATVGANLQVPVTITFSPPPASNVTLTITSSNPSLVLVGSAGATGVGQLQTTITAQTSSIATYVQALGSTGSVTITAAVGGYTSGIGTVTLANSGFVLSGPNGIGANFTTYEGVGTTLSVYAARLNAAGGFVETEQVRGGYTVNVPISSNMTTVGTVSTSSVAFSGGTDTVEVQFLASATSTGTTTVALGPPPPLPSTGYSLVVTVNQSGLIPLAVTVGKNLQVSTSISLTGRPLSPVVVTLQSKDPTRMKFSTSATGTPATSINVTIPANQTSSPDFYVLAYDSTGSVEYTATTTGYGSIDTTVPLAPSGLVIQTPSGAGADFSMSLGVGNATLTIFSDRLNGSGTPVEQQEVASGQSIVASVVSSDQGIGTITTSPITITGGSFSASTQFQPVGNGQTTITASSSGYGSGIVHATVQQPTLVVAGGFSIGKYLQQDATLILPVPAPTGGVDVTLHSNSALLLLSSSQTTVGLATLVIHMDAGSQFATYYLQSLGSSGSPTYTANASGYSQGTGTVDLAPSSVVIVAPSGNSISLSGGAQQFTVSTAYLDSTLTPVTPQALAPGLSLTVTLNNTNNATGTVSPNPVTISPPNSGVSTTFTPKAQGTTTVSVVQPTGWTTPASLGHLDITVVP